VDEARSLKENQDRGGRREHPTTERVQPSWCRSLSSSSSCRRRTRTAIAATSGRRSSGFSSGKRAVSIRRRREGNGTSNDSSDPGAATLSYKTDARPPLLEPVSLRPSAWIGDVSLFLEDMVARGERTSVGDSVRSTCRSIRYRSDRNRRSAGSVLSLHVVDRARAPTSRAASRRRAVTETDDRCGTGRRRRPNVVQRYGTALLHERARIQLRCSAYGSLCSRKTSTVDSSSRGGGGRLRPSTCYGSEKKIGTNRRCRHSIQEPPSHESCCTGSSLPVSERSPTLTHVLFVDDRQYRSAPWERTRQSIKTSINRTRTNEGLGEREGARVFDVAARRASDWRLLSSSQPESRLKNPVLYLGTAAHAG
jgi:hypothetical protein